LAKTVQTAALDVSLEVLQNGIPVAATTRRFGHTSDVVISSAEGAALSLPNYPLTGAMVVVTSRKGKTFIVLDRPWEGFVVSGGEHTEVERTERSYREIPIGKGDYASLALGDLRLLVKVAPKTVVRPTKIDPAYRGSLVGLLVQDGHDAKGLFLGVLIAIVVAGGFIGALSATKPWRPKDASELSESYTVPFINPANLRNAPEALQDSLDRTRFIPSVTSYYSSLIGMVLGWKGVDEQMLYDTSVDTWSQVHEKQQQLIAEAELKQRRIETVELERRGTALISLPAVSGESIDDSVRRVIDKIEIHNQSLVDQIALRREITVAFPKDEPYDFNEYRSLGKPRQLVSDETREALAKIRPFAELTDEEAMYAAGERLARKSEVTRHRREITANAAQGSAGEEGPPAGSIEIAAGIEYASFLSGIDYLLADEKFFQLEASEYGGKATKSREAPKIREPLIGEIEPALIERTIAKYRFELQLCFELALRRNNLTRGVMEWRWRIDSRGMISDINLVSSTITDQNMASCIREKMSKWRFPRPRRGSVEISYPFEFNPRRG